MKIREILRKKGHEVVTIEGERTVLEAVRRLVEHRIGGLVVTRGNAPVGILTERDILHLTARAPSELHATTVEQAMTRDPLTTGLDADLHETMGVMTEERIRHLPVVEGGRLVGIVSIGDLLLASQRVLDRENRHLREYISGGTRTL